MGGVPPTHMGFSGGDNVSGGGGGGDEEGDEEEEDYDDAGGAGGGDDDEDEDDEDMDDAEQTAHITPITNACLDALRKWKPATAVAAAASDD